MTFSLLLCSFSLSCFEKTQIFVLSEENDHAQKDIPLHFRAAFTACSKPIRVSGGVLNLSHSQITCLVYS